MEFLVLGSIWILYSFLEGVREGYTSHYRSFSRFSRSKNMIFICTQRLLVFVIFSYLVFHSKDFLPAFIFSFGALSIFTYIQNGTYFLIRNGLNTNIFPDKQRTNCIEECPVICLNSVLRLRLAYFGIMIQSLLWVI